MPSIYLLRHGETEASRAGRMCGREDSPLTEGGIQALGRLRLPHADVVFSSPSSRCVHTASVAGYPQPVLESALCEVDFGAWEQHTFDEAAARDSDAAAAYLADPYAFIFPGGEGLADLERRIDDFIRTSLMPRVARGETILVVSHAGPLKMLLLLLLGMGAGHFWNIAILPAKASEIAYTYDGALHTHLVRLNGTEMRG